MYCWLRLRLDQARRGPPSRQKLVGKNGKLICAQYIQGVTLLEMGRFKLFKTVTTWLCVAILLLIGCFDSFSSVVCIHSDGEVDVESSDGFGHCVHGGESQLSENSSLPCLTESCLDLPLGGITGVPAPAKRLAPMVHNWSIPYCDWWGLTHLIAASSGDIENALVKLKYISHRQLASLVHIRSVLLLI